MDTAEGCDLFSKLATKRRQHVVQSESVAISNEIGNVQSSEDGGFPYAIRHMFIELNAGLPASAAVERLFSLGGLVFTPLRRPYTLRPMSNRHFEMIIICSCIYRRILIKPIDNRNQNGLNRIAK